MLLLVAVIVESGINYFTYFLTFKIVHHTI